MLRVCHVIPTLDLGGAETSLLELCGRLGDRGIGSAVVQLRSGGSLRPSFERAGIELHEVGVRGSLPSPADAARLLRMLRAIDPDVLQGWMYHGLLAATVASVGLRRVVPLVWTIRTTLVRSQGIRSAAPGIVSATRLLRGRPRLIIFNSRAGLRSHLQAGIRGRRMRVIPNGFDLARFRPDPLARSGIRRDLAIDDDVFLFGCLARLDLLKGHAVLLRAFADVSRRVPSARLLLVGTGMDLDQPPLAALIPSGIAPGRILAVGPRQDVVPWLAAMDALVVPSLVEGFPNSLGEGMAMGIPAICTDVGDARTMLGGFGVIVPPGEHAPLADAMLDLLQMPRPDRERLGLAARTRIERRYSADRMADDHARLYRSLAASR